ncbi:3-carboxy-cis,cis-muconate cycloisomerase [Aliirhizobium smilacinae]|uniref:3-carboxy-cis,cis-muconate cycloisomerase n=1 Tax=Aliirhizobium smilacinae TaxID=1395944 RepID=A0A5C4XIV9_9HYPH|nr:3-carboxy-cis,cis-muconate cycloisomerase [Rhizobium smilacinae]TNM63357.1 3-carboxy-cis,cis-muconate cycloisomerase [Rhizobium smilacinae]
MAISAFDHPFLCGLFGDEEVAVHLSAEADITAMLAFEAALARAEAKAGIVPAAAADRITEVCRSFRPDMEQLKIAVATDSVVVPELVRQLRRAIGDEEAQYLHVGATSQDVIDTSLMLRMKTILSLLASRVERVIGRLDQLDRAFGEQPLMAYTRMQAAIPITVSDRLRAWRDPLARHLQAINALEFPVQLGGAAGSLDRLGNLGDQVRAELARELALSDLRQWQNQRDPIINVGHCLSLVSGTLGKMGQDIALMAQSGGEIELSGGGTSSAMVHKQNPVAAEMLVTLARFNAVQISGLHQSLVHEQERSGAAWTLEWLLLPQMTMATAAALRLADQLVGEIRRIGTPA